MNKILALSGLLALALVGSYLSWTADPSGAAQADQIPLYTATQLDLKQIEWKSERNHLVLTRPTDALGQHVWVVDTERRQRPIPLEAVEPEGEAPEAEDPEGEAPEDAAPEEAEAPAPDTEWIEQTTAFLGSEAAHTAWANFSPLHALRLLGPASALDLSAMGFDEPLATLSITRGSGALELVVGGEAYGSKDRYVRLDDRIYLVDDATLRPLQFGSTRLVERALHPLTERAVVAVEVTLPDGSARSWTHRYPDDRARAYWAASDDLDTPDDAAGTWLGKVFRLRVNGYLTETQLDEPPQPIFRYTVVGDSDRWEVEVLRGTEEGREHIYARSAFNRSLVRLTRSIADEAIADLPSIFGR